jgi:hypothetical protein
MKPKIYISEEGVSVVSETGQSYQIWSGPAAIIGGRTVRLTDCEPIVVQTERIKEGEA